jgi:flagellar biosynthesis protein FlhG
VTLTTLYSPKGEISGAKSVIVAIGGGKGGVGKSFISSNIGIFLANMGFRTVMLDLDLGAPNLHTCLGEQPPRANFHDYLSGRVESLEETAVSTQIPKLRLITGANDHKERANITLLEQNRLMSAIYNLESDFTILDLSAGTHTSTLDFFLMAHRHIVTVAPDPTSIENAYRFMKAAFFRRIKCFERELQLESVISSLMSELEKNKIKFPSDLLATIAHVEPQKGHEFNSMMNRLCFELVINQSRSSKDIQLGHSIGSVAKKYFGVPVHVLGAIDYDNAVWNALRKRRPLLLECPHSSLYMQLLGIARDLASPHLKKAVI